MSEQTKLLWMPKAKGMEMFFKPLLDRSYQKWVDNNRKDVVSEYGGGHMIVITSEDGAWNQSGRQTNWHGRVNPPAPVDKKAERKRKKAARKRKARGRK